MKKNKTARKYLSALIFFVLFALFTAAVMAVDVQPIGPENSVVGFATINAFFFGLFGTNGFCYSLTKLLGYAAILVAGVFALIGFVQLIRRKSLKKVDHRLLLLAGFYALLGIFYVLFEKFIVNYRPVILDETTGLEASYPSSHTMLVLCIMATAYYLLPRLCKSRLICGIGRVICVIMMIAMPIGRLISGVHWFSDIVGACLLSAALIKTYTATAYTIGRSIRRKKRTARCG